MKLFQVALTSLVMLGVAFLPGGSPSAAGPHDYFNMLTSLSSHWKSYSFRNPAHLAHPADGGFANSNDRVLGLWVTYDPATDTDPRKQDAAKLVVPAFTKEAANRTTLAAPLDAAATSFVLAGGNPASSVLISLLARRTTLKIDRELMVITAWDNPTQTVTVQRGAHGTQPAAHVAGSPLWRSNNSLPNQLRVPLGTEDGHVYLFTWDGYWTDSYVGANISAHKTFQFTSGGDAIWLEARTRFDGGTRAFEVPGAFSPANDVGATDLRTYNAVGGNPSWMLTDGNRAGPRVTRDQPLEPRTSTPTFITRPNVWNRFWMKVDQRANDYDYIEFWAADEHVGPVKLYDKLPVSVRTNRNPNQIMKFWLEYNASNDLHTRGNERSLVAYARNFVALRDASNVESLLVRPAISGVAGPAPPRNVRVNQQ